MLISLAALLGGILNSLNKFWVNAAAPILLNLSMIAALWFFHGADAYATARAQAISVTVGGVVSTTGGVVSTTGGVTTLMSGRVTVFI